MHPILPQQENYHEAPNIAQPRNGFRRALFHLNRARELKYALFAHTERSLALAARASYATLLGVEDLNFHVASLDLSAGKKLGRFAPYVGLGLNWSRALETTAKVRLANETLITPRGVVGTELSLGLVSFTTELEIAAVPTFSLRTGFKL